MPIGTFGEIATRQISVRRYRASARLRDWDGQTRQVPHLSAQEHRWIQD